MSRDTELAHIVSLACHDLRTPLATVTGFAHTLAATDDLPEPAARYVELIDAAARQLDVLVDDLALAARIESGRYEPTPEETSTAALAARAAALAGVGVAPAPGPDASLVVDVEAVERALAALAAAARSHGGAGSVSIRPEGRRIRVGPVAAGAAAALLGAEARDLGAAVALRVLAATGASVELDGVELVVDF